MEMMMCILVVTKNGIQSEASQSYSNAYRKWILLILSRLIMDLKTI